MKTLFLAAWRLCAFALNFLSFILVQQFSQRAFGVMQSRFHRAELRFRDARDFFERKIIDEVQQQHGPLRQRQSVQQFHKFSFLLAANQQFIWTVFKSTRRFGNFFAQHFVAALFAPALDAFLVRDAEKPASEFPVIAQAADVPDGGDERLLHDVEARLFVVRQ
jgi:hypothetical protein